MSTSRVRKAEDARRLVGRGREMVLLGCWLVVLIDWGRGEGNAGWFDVQGVGKFGGGLVGGHFGSCTELSMV